MYLNAFTCKVTTDATKRGVNKGEWLEGENMLCVYTVHSVGTVLSV